MNLGEAGGIALTGPAGGEDFEQPCSGLRVFTGLGRECSAEDNFLASF